MGSWNEVKLEKFLTQKRRQVLIDNDAKYSLVTVSNKGEVKLREVKSGATISAQKGYIAKAGDFIYSRLSVHTGAFGIVPAELNNALITNEMPCFEIDQSKILPEILIKMIGLPDFLWQLKQLTKGMGRVRIKESMMLSLSLILPGIDEQRAIVKFFKSVETEDAELKTELTHQQTLLKKLRQQILQEAIEGKLTADWRADNPDIEPASELLKRIQAEKAQLIKDKKIKKQKPLPPISEDEKPFELPHGWVWCRLGDVAGRVFDGPFGSNLMTKDYVSAGVRLIRLENIGVLEFKNSKKTFITQDKYNALKQHFVRGGDIIFSSFISNEVRVSILPEYIDCAVNKADCFCIRVDNLRLSREYIEYYLSTKSTYRQLVNEVHGDTRPRINTTQLRKCNVALPPLPEQKAIVTKVEKLLALCDQLESQITRNQSHAEQLMQAVLKEAFTSEAREQAAANA